MILAALAGSTAFADVVPPEETACRNALEGSSCTVEEMGTVYGTGSCQDSFCWSWKEGSGGLWAKVQGPCLKCLDQYGKVPYSQVAIGDGAGGCSVAGTETRNEFWALLVAGSFSLLFLIKRRRQKK